jgi:hypothetical protein
MTAEQAAKNIKAKIDELANKAAERMDALADVVSDHNWLDPRVRHRAVEHVVREVLVDFPSDSRNEASCSRQTPPLIRRATLVLSEANEHHCGLHATTVLLTLSVNAAPRPAHSKLASFG